MQSLLRRFPLWQLACLSLVASLSQGCGPDDGNASFQVRESVAQLQISHAQPGSALVLADAEGVEIQRGQVDDLGSLLFRKIPAGEDYRVQTEGVDPQERSRPLKVMSEAGSLPAPDFYTGQQLHEGFGYITTRDGTQLSVFVVLPGPEDKGPYPTVVNYSGYSPSEPGGPLDPAFSSLCTDYPVLCTVPNHPSGLIAGLMGYATVGVNMRGTGCSGGAYDYFETLQRLDGYDMIEAIAAQPWVKGHKVGMVGLSYPGISQLFVAREQPPSLAAITPLSVIGNTFTTLAPGGILNDGFALEWVNRVVAQADPYGQGWEQAQVDAGDAICAENQLMHGQKLNAVQSAFDNPYITEEVADPVNPSLFVDKIDVPVFLAGAWQDEQTGPGFAALLDRFTSSPVVKRSLYNGVHPDGYSPQILIEWKAFLDIYVAEELRPLDTLVRNLGPQIFASIFGVNVPMPADKFAEGISLADAKASFEAEEDIRVLFDVGAAAGQSNGAPVAAFEQRFPSWPVPGLSPKRLYLAPDGALGESVPTTGLESSSFTIDPSEGDRGILAQGAKIWDPVPAWDWKDSGPTHAVAFVSAALPADLVMVGYASADLEIMVDADNVDIEVTLSEVRPDGKELYVQNGWIRASQAAALPESTELHPVASHMKVDEKALVPGEWRSVRVPFEAFAHVFRAGSAIRLSIDTPGGSRAEWRFRLLDQATAPTVTIGHGAAHGSSLVLPVVGGVSVPTGLPPCPGLRGQPCRGYQPYTNTP